MNRLREKYENSVKAELSNKFNYTSSMQIPKIEKIVINMGCGDAVANSKVLDEAVEELTLIAGQSQLLLRLKSQLQTLSFVKECLSDARLHYVVRRCMNSSTS